MITQVTVPIYQALLYNSSGPLKKKTTAPPKVGFVPDDDENMSYGISGSMNATFSSLLITSMYGFLYCFIE